jgi:hypothetical protein
MSHTKGMTQFTLSDASIIIANYFFIGVYCLCPVGCSAFSAAVRNLCCYVWLCHLSPILPSQYTCVSFGSFFCKEYCLLSYNKPTRYASFSNSFFEWKSTCFGQFLCPSSGVFHCARSNGVCHTGLLTGCTQDKDGTSFSCLQDKDGTSLSGFQAVSKLVWHILLPCAQWNTPDDRQRNCPKHVEFHSKNKFEKLVHLVGFILRNLTLHSHMNVNFEYCFLLCVFFTILC